MEDFNKRGMWGKVITTHNTREEEVLAEFDERFVTALSTEYKTRIREWIKYTLHQELQKAREEERERIEAIFKEHVPPHAMDLEDSVWLKRLLNKAFNHDNNI